HRVASSRLLFLIPYSSSVSPFIDQMSRRAGDWNCSLCQHHNFSRRDSCQQCGQPRLCSGDFGGSSFGGFGAVSEVRPGDWYCSCGGHNFASRSSCHSCGAFRDESAVGVIGGFDNSEMAGSQGITYGGGGWKSGDWLCTRSGCNHHNFASRRECYRCKAPKGCGNCLFPHNDQSTLFSYNDPTLNSLMY
ncbi:unnamed protein product, partial [Musa textilis]